MKRMAIFMLLFTHTLSAIDALKFSFDTYETVIFFTPFNDDPFRGTITNETELFGQCKGDFFYDLEHGRLSLNFIDEKCAKQNLVLYLEYEIFNKLKNGSPTRTYFEREEHPYDPQQVTVQIYPKIQLDVSNYEALL